MWQRGFVSGRRKPYVKYVVKGFVLDDERLKNPDQPFDYFDELIRRIQDIRTSERRFYQKITVQNEEKTMNNSTYKQENHHARPTITP